MNVIKQFIVEKGHLIIIAITVLLAVNDLFHVGLLPTHDGEYHIIRFYEFDKVLRNGIWYPRWAPDLNNAYGVPLFNYVYPLPNYIASFLHIFTISFIDGFKISMILATMLAAFGMYLFSKMYFGKWGGVLSMIFYTVAPYRFVDIYIRGSIGEVWALTFLPYLLFFITQGVKTKQPFYFWIGSIILSLLVFSHNILAVMFTAFALCYTIFLLWKETSWKLWSYCLGSFLIGFGISAIFWLPALFEQKFVDGLQVYNVSSNFPELYQLLIPSWGSGFSAGSLENQMSFQIGVANILVILALFLLLFRLQKKQILQRKYIIFFLFSFFIVCFFLLRISEPVWKIIPLFKYFQFPWRFLSLIIFLCSFLAGSLVLFKKKLIPITFAILAVLLSISYAKAPFYFQRNDQYYISKDNFIYGTNSPGDTFNTVWMNRKLPKSQTTGLLFYNKEINQRKNGMFTIPIAYFPGWSVNVDGKNVQPTHDTNGLISAYVPSGNHIITAAQRLTFIQFISTFISGIAICILFLLCFRTNLSKIVRRS